MKEFIAAILGAALLFVGAFFFPQNKEGGMLGGGAQEILYGSSTQADYSVSSTPVKVYTGGTSIGSLEVCHKSGATNLLWSVRSTSTGFTSSSQGAVIFTSTCKKYQRGEDLFGRDLWLVANTSTNQTVGVTSLPPQ